MVHVSLNYHKLIAIRLEFDKLERFTAVKIQDCRQQDLYQASNMYRDCIESQLGWWTNNHGVS